MLKAIDAKVFCCILLFTEPRVGKARAGKLEEDASSHRNCKYIYPLLSSKVAAAAAAIQYSFVVDRADRALSQLTSPIRAFQVALI